MVLRYLLDFFLGIVNQRAEFRLFFRRQPLPKDIIDLLPDNPGAVVEDMEKRCVLPMQITHEVLNPLGQRQPGLQINQLFINRFLGGIFFCQQTHNFVGPALYRYTACHSDHPRAIILIDLLLFYHNLCVNDIG